MDVPTWYFPPNPEKLGDNLLTLDIALEVAGQGLVVYHCTKFVAAVLGGLVPATITFATVRDVTDSAERAASVQQCAMLRIVDLQRLNCWVDYPELRPLFGAVPDRAHLDWFAAEAVARYDLQSFSGIFRQIIGLGPPPPLGSPPKRLPSSSPSCVVAPHCETDFQQHADWPLLVAALAESGMDVVVVGRSPVLGLGPWHRSVSVVTDLPGEDLLRLVARSTCLVGGATGITHLADQLGVPTVGIWKIDDRVVFGPRRTTTRTLVVDRIQDALDQVARLLLEGHRDAA